MKIQTNIAIAEQNISLLQEDLQRSNTLLSQYQESHWSSDQEIEFLKDEIAKMWKVLGEQDRLIESLSIQIAQ